LGSFPDVLTGDPLNEIVAMRIPLFLFGYVQVSVDSFSNLSLLTLITQNKKPFTFMHGNPVFLIIIQSILLASIPKHHSANVTISFVFNL
jgi:hypothetical protein